MFYKANKKSKSDLLTWQWKDLSGLIETSNRIIYMGSHHCHSRNLEREPVWPRRRVVLHPVNHFYGISQVVRKYLLPFSWAYSL